MYEVACAACNASFEYNLDDYIHLCPYCSSGFVLELEEGVKDLIGDHYIIQNRLDKSQVEHIFYDWISERYHRKDKVNKEFSVLGCYGIMLPYWIVSAEAHTLWSGYSVKGKQYTGQSAEYGARFLREDGKFSRRYRWAVLARKSPKEHWGLERLHRPRENILVDWDGFPFDETMGVLKGSEMSPYEQKQGFKFEQANGLSVAGIQEKELIALSRARDQIQEYHRRISKTKVGTLHEHRTEIEIIGIHLIHVPFWFLRYSFTPHSFFRFFTTARERRILINGFTEKILEAELPLNTADKVMTNFIVCSCLALVSLCLAIVVHFTFIFLFIIFVLICVLSAWKIFSKEKIDKDIIKMFENNEPFK